jgi:hypothetical protein
MRTTNPSRRSFLKKSALAAAAATVTPALTTLVPKSAYAADEGPGNKWRGRVVINYNNTHACTVTGGTEGDESTTDESIVKKMVDDSIKLLTGESTVGAAWKATLPASLTVASKIALKINILTNDVVPPHPFVLMGITEGLQQMDFDGTLFPAANISIYDGNSSGDFATLGITAARFPGITIAKAGLNTAGGARNKNYSNALAAADFLINVPVCRGHWSSYGSVTLGFKSHFGTYDVNSHTDNHAYLRDINCTGPVLAKTVMTVFATLFGKTLGNGPTGSANSYLVYAKTMDADTTNAAPNTIIMSTDPVSAEYQAIKMMRTQAGLTTVVSNMPLYLQASGGVAGSLSTVYDIGEIDPDNMIYCEIVNGTITFTSVELTGFAATLLANGVQLGWQTATETDNLGWNIFRKTDQDTVFVKINTALVPGQGTTAQPHAYTYPDTAIPAGAASAEYYLEQVDLDGSRHNSPLVALALAPTALHSAQPEGMASPAACRITPNPFRHTVEIQPAQTDHVRVTITNQTGTPVRELTGPGRMTWDGRDSRGHRLPNGPYWVTMTTPGGTSVYRLLKIK